jgi:hypothetical protein
MLALSCNNDFIWFSVLIDIRIKLFTDQIKKLNI